MQPKDSSGISPPSAHRRQRGVARPPSAEAAASAHDNAKGGGEGTECNARQQSCVILRRKRCGGFFGGDERVSNYCKLVVEKIGQKSDLHTARCFALHFWEVVLSTKKSYWVTFL